MFCIGTTCPGARSSGGYPTCRRKICGYFSGASRRTAPLDIARIRTIVTEACEGLIDVDAERIIDESLNNMYDGISATDVATSVLITARMVEEEPNYTYVSARLLLDESH